MHYSYESQALQIAPWAFESSHPWSLAVVRGGGRGLATLFRRRRSPAARVEGWKASPRRCAPGGGRDRVGVDYSGGATRTVWPAVELNGGGGAPVVRGGEEVVEELQGDVEKLGVEAIGVEEGRRRWLHGEQKVAAGGDGRHLSGSRCGALGIQLGGHKASWDQEEST
jgi:hypothetical protein